MDNNGIKFVCNKCDGELFIEENGKKYREELYMDKLGSYTKKIKVFKATCKKCGVIDNDYFNK